MRSSKDNGNNHMILKLPQFLILSLDENLLGRCTIEHQLKITDDARREKEVAYTLIGFISKSSFHYSYFRKE